MKLIQISCPLESFRQIGAKLLIVGTIPLLTVLTAHAATPGDTDIDGDGIPNSVDIDDDNDGILDTEEGSSQTDDIQDSGVDGALDASNVSFGITSTDPGVPSTPHFIDSITVSGVNALMDGVYNDLITPNSVVTDFSVSANQRVRRVDNGVFVADVNIDANYDDLIVPAFQDLNLQNFQLLDTEDFTADSYTLFYDTPVISNAGGFVAFTERNGNNPLQAEAYDIDDNFLGSINLVTSDYINTNHVANINQDIYLAMYAIDDLAPVGSEIASIRITLLGNTSDGPDGKVFIYGDANRLSTGIDTDGDGVFDHQDLDSDNDGIPDVQENGATSIQLLTDTNGDGIISVAEAAVPNSGVADADGDGLFDIFDADNNDISDAASIGNVAVDTDNDGIVDFLDLDSDNDGLTDAIEAGGTDNNGDGLIDGFVDVNCDGWHDTVQATPLPVDDFDGDGTQDFRDLDSDNDGLTDTFEAGGADTTGNGIIDGFTDSNDDGLDDATAAAMLPREDTDGDGNVDYLDLDSDNDGITDTTEAGGTDTNGDGEIDGFSDSNDDGLNDATLTAPLPVDDFDNDGIEDFLSLIHI